MNHAPAPPPSRITRAPATMNSFFFDFLTGATSSASVVSTGTAGAAIDAFPLQGQWGADDRHYRNKPAPSISQKEGEKARIAFDAGRVLSGEGVDQAASGGADRRVNRRHGGCSGDVRAGKRRHDALRLALGGVVLPRRVRTDR